MAFTVPAPRPAHDDARVTACEPVRDQVRGSARDVARWYENRLGWATADNVPAAGPAPYPPSARLLTGLRFDVLDLPAPVGLETLRRLPGGQGPVALSGCRERLWLLVAAGSAEELPGLLDWLEWSGVGLDLAVWGAGRRIPAPTPPGWTGSGAPGAAVWLRAPVPGHEVEPTLPGMPTLPGPSSPVLPAHSARTGSGSEGPGLVRLVAVAAAECHRQRLLAAHARRQGAAAQRLASS
uniref:Proline-rich protein n=1 Tax=Streptomyces tenjimariensis TaxID=29308 RepID=Q2UZF7_9ACTN|nr:proline-rich protein [Streptomyces tenjimariensis]